MFARIKINPFLLAKQECSDGILYLTCKNLLLLLKSHAAHDAERYLRYVGADKQYQHYQADHGQGLASDQLRGDVAVSTCKVMNNIMINSSMTMNML